MSFSRVRKSYTLMEFLHSNVISKQNRAVQVVKNALDYCTAVATKANLIIATMKAMPGAKQI